MDKTIIQKGGNFLYLMLILTIMIDPGNSILHMKDVFFILLVAYNCVFFKPDFTYIPHLLTIISAFLICTVISEAEQSFIDKDFYLATIKGFSPLILLLWSPYYDVIKLSKWPAVLLCIIIWTLYILICVFEPFEYLIWKFASNNNDMIKMAHRTFLGFRVYGMNYTSIVTMIFVMFISYYTTFNNKKKRIRNILLLILTSFCYLISGTRATILTPFFLLGLGIYTTVTYKNKIKYFIYPILFLFLTIFGFLIITLALESNESSNAVKYGHILSYINLFDTNPEYLLWGQGPGAIFYSEGFNKWVPQTEWTYLELLRNYGVFSLMILAVLVSPLFRLYQYRNNLFVLGMGITYIFYLFMAGTNPILISSTGMLVILSIFSFTDKLNKENGECRLIGIKR